MADSKISELTALTSPANDDVLAIVDTSAGVTKKITVSNLNTASFEVVDDTSPQLGGTLDTNGNLIQFGDSGGATDDRLQFGASQDLQIYHDGSNSNITDVGTGKLVLRSDGTGVDINKGSAENIAKFIVDGAVELYYDNSKKFETTSTGIDITGTVTSTGGNFIVEDGNGFRFGDGSYRIEGKDDGGSARIGFVTASSEIARFTTTGLGISTSSPQAPLDVVSNSSAVGIDLRGRSSDNIAQFSFESNDSGTTYSQLQSFSSELKVKTVANIPMSFHTNNTERVRIDSSGKVAIGSTDNGVGGTIDLSVGSTSSSGGITLWSPTSGTHSLGFGDGTSGADRYRGYLEYAHNGDSMRFATASTERMRIDSSGNVGIGNSSPNSFNSQARNLVVGSGSGANGLTIYSANNSTGNIFFADGTSGSDPVRGGVNYNHSSNEMYFRVNDSNRLIIDSSGNVGIGTSSPINTSGYAGLSLNSSTGGIIDFIDDGTQKVRIVGSNAEASIQYTGNFNLVSGLSGGSEVFRVDSSGNVGIGNSTPSSYDGGADNLVVGTHTTSSNGITIASDDNSILYFADGTSGDEKYRGSIIYNHPADNFIFRTAGFNARMTITSSGNVLIGQTTSPASNAGLGIASTASGDSASMYLDTYAANQSQSTFFIRASKNNTVGTKSETSSGQDLGSIYFQGVNSSSAFGYGANITATQTGAAGSSKIPTALIFGTATNSALAERMRITDAGLHIGGTGAANALDDYEEGTWTPVLGSTGSYSGQVYASAVGNYTKIGRQVTLHMKIVLTNAGTVGDFSTIFGLPFTPATTSEGSIPIAISKITLTSGHSPIATWYTGGSARIYLQQQDGAGSLDQITASGVADDAQVYMTATFLV